MSMNRAVVLGIVCSCSGVAIQCGKAGSQPAPPAASSSPVSPAARASATSPVRFKTVTCVDKDGIGIEAFRLLAPADWQGEGGVRWLLDNPLMPGVVDFRVRNPSGPEEVQVIPSQAFFWSNNPTVMSLFPPGKKYFGAEVRKPVSALEALKTVVLPRFRGDAVDLKVVAGEALPDLARQVGKAGQPGMSADAARVRVEYARGGVAMEEELYAVVESMSYPVQTMSGPVTHTNWFVNYTVAFRAEKGRLDAQARTFQTIVHSFKVNPQWFNKYNQLVEMLIQQKIQQIRNIGEIGRMISKTGSEIREDRMKAWTERQAVNDRIVDDFCRGIRGVELYHDPFENKPVELPGGYGNVWANRSGEYILTESPGFNPNVGSNVEWQRIEKTR
jgi:hypothetical protein